MAFKGKYCQFHSWIQDADSWIICIIFHRQHAALKKKKKNPGIQKTTQSINKMKNQPTDVGMIRCKI